MNLDSTACDSILWDGATVTTSGTYYDTLQNTAGCDSIVTLNLTINQSITGTDLITAFDNYTWIDGINYDSSNNTAIFNLTSQTGCDSIVTLNLTILKRTYVPDDNFELYLETHDANGNLVTIGDASSMGDGIANNDSVTTANISGVTSLDVSNQNITNLTGIEDFLGLTYLSCQENLINS